MSEQVKVNRLTLIIEGRPITKKNHQRVVINSGQPFVIQSKYYRRFERRAKEQIGTQFTYNGPIETQVWVTYKYWMPNRRSIPDLGGLEAATDDILESAGVLENDRLIVSHDGSRIYGIDPDNPRTEVLIRDPNPEWEYLKL